MFNVFADFGGSKSTKVVAITPNVSGERHEAAQLRDATLECYSPRLRRFVAVRPDCSLAD